MFLHKMIELSGIYKSNLCTAVIIGIQMSIRCMPTGNILQSTRIMYYDITSSVKVLDNISVYFIMTLSLGKRNLRIISLIRIHFFL